MLERASQEETERINRFHLLAKAGWLEVNFTTRCYHYDKLIGELAGLPGSMISFDDFHHYVAEEHHSAGI